MAPPTLYDYDASPPCVLVRLVARLVDVELKKVKVKDIVKEMATPEMTQKNPQRTVPTLEDNGLCISESRAIAMYLISKYAKHDSLYPKDPQKRVLVDQRLFFDVDIYGAILNVWRSVISGKSPDQSLVDKINGGLETWDRMLEGKHWLAGDSITLADYSAAIVVTTTKYIPKVEFTPLKHKNIAQWLSRVDSSSSKYVEEMKFFQDSLQALAKQKMQS